ncbi:MAG: hypothetical protein IJU74_05805, partial [Bacteroidales bacterium]|nr:hypothetical protein [Bacteroidales bacterium]
AVGAQIQPLAVKRYSQTNLVLVFVFTIGKKLERRIALNFHIPVPPELKSYPKNIPKTGGVKKLHLQKYAIEII